MRVRDRKPNHKKEGERQRKGVSHMRKFNISKEREREQKRKKEWKWLWAKRRGKGGEMREEGGKEGGKGNGSGGERERTKEGEGMKMTVWAKRRGKGGEMRERGRKGMEGRERERENVSPQKIRVKRFYKKIKRKK